MRGTMTWLLRASFALALCAPAIATAQTPAPLRPIRSIGGPAIMPAASVLPCDAMSIDSPPGKAWWAQEHWRYQTDAEAIAAYQALVNGGKGTSPWPTWYLPAPGLGTATPPLTVLPVGTRFQMALKPGQKKESPGAWGTFDYIADVQDVREFLAVIHFFKPEIDRVVTYEVTQMLPVLIGPVGPQVDTESCQYYPGRWSQFQMLPKWDQVMGYLKVVEVRTIQ